MSTDVREAVVANLRRCIRRGIGLPERPNPADLWDACGGDGYLALLVMLEFVAAERLVKDEKRVLDDRDRRDRLELGVLAA